MHPSEHTCIGFYNFSSCSVSIGQYFIGEYLTIDMSLMNYILHLQPVYHTGNKTYLPPVMWSETVSLRTRPVSDQKIGLGLVGLVLCCETTRSCHARHCKDFDGHKLFKYYLYFLYSVVGTSLLWRATVAFTYWKVKSARCLCLLPMVLVL